MTSVKTYDSIDIGSFNYTKPKNLIAVILVQWLWYKHRIFIYRPQIKM